MKPRQQDWSRPVTNWLRPGLVRTSLVTAKRPRPTTVDQSLVVRSSLLWFRDLQRPVSVLVQASRRQKTRPDFQTLSGTPITVMQSRGLSNKKGWIEQAERAMMEVMREVVSLGHLFQSMSWHLPLSMP